METTNRREIDVFELKDTLIDIKKQLLRNNSFSMFVRDYNDYCKLNSLLYSISGLSMSGNGIICDNNEFKTRVKKYNKKTLDEYYNGVIANKEVIETIFENYRGYLEYIGLINLPYPKKTKQFTEKDMFDIVLEYYNTFGNNYVKTVKNLLDNSRYESLKGSSEEYSGATYFYRRKNKGFVTTDYTNYNTYNLITTVHEIGHLYEFENFIGPSVKEIPLKKQYGMELCSCFFEMEFLEYLRQNHIDIDTSDAALINRLMNLYEFGFTFDEVFKIKNKDVKFNGDIVDKDSLIPKRIELKNALIYGIGFYFALHICELYENNPQEAMQLFNRMIASRAETNIVEKMEILDIDPNTFCSNEMIRERILKVSNSTRKRFNINL